MSIEFVTVLLLILLEDGHVDRNDQFPSVK